MRLFYKKQFVLVNQYSTGKGTAECWSQKKGSCIFIEMVWDNCVCFKVKWHSLAASPKRIFLYSDGISVNNKLLNAGQEKLL